MSRRHPADEAAERDLRRLEAATGRNLLERPVGPAVALRAFDGIHAVPIRWLWPGWLARGKLHILAGAPGTGKTTAALSLAATVSSGGRWPDDRVAPAGAVLIWSGEDDAADTLKPRLMAAGADVGRCYLVDNAMGEDGEPRPFDPSRDLIALEKAAERVGDVALLIADPVVSAVVGDSHKNVEVRRALQPLVDLGARLGCAVVGISHFTKGTAGRDPVERVTGSIAFGAVARVVMVAAKGEDGRMLARAKSNIGPDGGGFAYELETAEVEGIEASRVRWGDPLEGTARELLGDVETEPGARDGAAHWLADLLANGSEPVKRIKAEAREAGFTWRTVERAKTDLGVAAARCSEGNAGGGYWAWSLPKTATARPPAQPQDLAVLPETSNGEGSSGSKTARPPSSQRGGLASVTPLHPDAEAYRRRRDGE